MGRQAAPCRAAGHQGRQLQVRGGQGRPRPRDRPGHRPEPGGQDLHLRLHRKGTGHLHHRQHRYGQELPGLGHRPPGLPDGPQGILHRHGEAHVAAEAGKGGRFPSGRAFEDRETRAPDTGRFWDTALRRQWPCHADGHRGGPPWEAFDTDSITDTGEQMVRHHLRTDRGRCHPGQAGPPVPKGGAEGRVTAEGPDRQSKIKGEKDL